MPIRINFLAEHQAEQEERRKDPVKLAALGVLLIMAMLVFCIAVALLLPILTMGTAVKM